MNIGLLANIGCFFLGKTDCGIKHFSVERKNGRFSVIPAGTRSVVIVQPSFLDDGPKLRVLIIANWEWPETAENRGEPRKMTSRTETDFFLG